MSFLGINGPATAQQTKESQARLRAAIATVVDDAASYTVVYGSSQHSGMVSIMISSYAIGFNEQTADMLIVGIDVESDANGEAVHIVKSDNPSVSIKMKSLLKVKTKEMQNALEITLPHRNNENAADIYQLPIQQNAEIEALNQFVNTNYEPVKQ